MKEDRSRRQFIIHAQPCVSVSIFSVLSSFSRKSLLSLLDNLFFSLSSALPLSPTSSLSITQIAFQRSFKPRFCCPEIPQFLFLHELISPSPCIYCNSLQHFQQIRPQKRKIRDTIYRPSGEFTLRSTNKTLHNAKWANHRPMHLGVETACCSTGHEVRAEVRVPFIVNNWYFYKLQGRFKFKMMLKCGKVCLFFNSVLALHSNFGPSYVKVTFRLHTQCV